MQKQEIHLNVWLASMAIAYKYIYLPMAKIWHNYTCAFPGLRLLSIGFMMTLCILRFGQQQQQNNQIKTREQKNILEDLTE